MIKEIQLVYADVEPLRENHGFMWKNCLLRRRHHFPAGGAGEEDLAVRIKHADEDGIFPLGTADEEAAAARAGHIYQFLIQHGWKTVRQKISRELILGFEWSLNPLLWTYTTIHTLTGDQAAPEPRLFAPQKRRRLVLVIEPDEGVRRALCWSIDQQAPFVSMPCGSVEAFTRALVLHQPSLVLLNRHLAGELDFTPGAVASLPSGAKALTYSVYADGDQMFDSTPIGDEGYLIKRVKPERLLEPLFNGQAHEVADEDPLARVKAYFQAFLQSSVRRHGSPVAKLSRREREVLALLSKGQVDKEIARALGISVWTVHGYVKSIFERLDVHTRTQAVVRYLEK